MGIEIERKFLVTSLNFKEFADPVQIIQGYLNTDPEKTIRVRIYGDRAFLTIKGKVKKFSRPEFEYEIPLTDAKDLLKLCSNPIEKERYPVKFYDHLWEVDVFLEKNKGLIIAEIELSRPDELFAKPDWIGREVSDDKRYFNSYLSRHPYTSWQQ